MSSTQQAETAKSKRAKREELFKREQGRMLEGYAANSFQQPKQPSRKRERQVPRSKPTGEDLAGGRTNSNFANTQKLGQNDKSISKQQEFANILDQMSLNSSSKNPLNVNINKENKAFIQTLPSNGNQLNLNKSKSGMIKSKVNPIIEMKIQDASVTINPNATDGGGNRPIGLDEVNIQFRQQDNLDESQKQFELNKQQFELEDPYAQSQKINGTDFRRESSKSKSRGGSREKRGGSREKRHRSRENKVSAFEKYEEIRFACYELQQKLAGLTSMVGGVAKSLGDQSNPGLNMQNQTIEVPISFIEQMQAITQEVGDDFGSVQNQWGEYFGEQQLSSQRQRSKNRQIKKKLRGLENQNQHQSQLYIRDQQEFERSLQTITKAHDANQDQMGQYLDQVETQVSQLKNTRADLNCRYEGQLDAAVKQMVNFYDNLETADPQDIDSDNMSIEQIFFIKPTHQITQTINKRVQSQLRISPRVLSSETREVAGRARSQNTGYTPTHVKIPKLPFERLQAGWEPEQPKIILERQTHSQAVVGSTPDQYTNQQPMFDQQQQNYMNDVSQNQQDQNYASNNTVQRQEIKESTQISQSQINPYQQNTDTANQTAQDAADAQELDANYQNGVDYVSNPVMVGAMQLESGFDKKYEDDYDGANVTMDMATDRLQQFPDAYEAINAVECPNERIILKQLLFMKHERILQKQAKVERKRKRKIRKIEQAAAAAAAAEAAKKKVGTPGSGQKSRKVSAERTVVRTFAPTPTNKKTIGHFGKLKNPALGASKSRGALSNAHESSMSSIGRKNPKQESGLGMNERVDGAIDDTYNATSRFSLQTELPSIDTVDMISAQRKFKHNAQDVSLTEVLDAEEVMVDGLRTATQTSLVKHYEEAFRQKDIIRNQHKGDEVKINYNSTNNSKMSHIGKQMSQGPHGENILNNYASNNSIQAQPIFIADYEEYSINSDLKELNRASSKNVMAPQQVGYNLDMSGLPPQSVKSKKSTQQPRNNFSVRDENSFLLSQDPHSQEKGDRAVAEHLETDDNSLGYPPEMRQEESEERPVDASLVSGASQYQRYLDNQEGSPSVNIKNSFVQSDQSPSQLQINDTTPNDHFDPIQEEDENQNQEYLDHLQMNEQMMRQRPLALDVIQERQSEFSQSMITNAARINTNRSKLSRASKNHGASHYQNLNQGQSFHLQPGASALASVRSDANNGSANRKDSSQGITQENITNDTGKMSRKYTEIEDYRLMVRSSSQAHTHRGGADTSLNQSGNRMYAHASIGDQAVCIDGSLIHSRNAHRKNSNSSREINDRDYIQLHRQPSAGKIDNQNRQKFFQNFEQDLSNMLITGSKGSKGQSKVQVQKNKSLGAKNDGSNNVPSSIPNGRSGNKDKNNDSRNHEIYQSKDSRKVQSYANDSSNIMPSNSEHEKQNQSYMPHSYRSQNIHGGESMRDRSYFDESPALFDKNGYAIESGIPSQQRATDMVKDSILGTYSSQQVEDTLQAHIQSLKSGQGEIIDPSAQHRFDASIHTHMLQMQSIPSFPQSSCHSTARDRQSKHSRVTQHHLAISKGSQPVSGLAESLTHQDLNLDNTFENAQGGLSGNIIIKPENEKHELPEIPRKPLELIRSNSECQLRDKAFYEMCADEDEVAMYCKLAEQNIFDAIHGRNLSQAHTNGNGNTHTSPAQLFPSNMNISNANKSSSINNQMVFMSQQTYKKMCGGYMQTQEKTQMGHQIGQIAGATSGVVDQNSSQQQTRGKGTFKRFLGDPSRLLMSINGNGQGNPQAMNNYLGLNLLASSLDDGTLSNNIMMPTHKYNRRTLLMMQNLHNNYLYSNHSGILFTMQRGWNSGYSSAVGGVPDGFQNLTGLNAAAGMTADKGPSQNDVGLKSLGGEPVNISNLLMGAKQQTADPLHAGSITIVDDDGKHMIDRKLLLEANNSASQQTNARRLLSQSRHINGQVTSTSDFSSLQTKQLGILRNTYAATSLRAAKNQRKISDPALDAGAPVIRASTDRDTAGTPVHLSCYGSQPDEVTKHRKDSGADRSSDSMRQSKCSSNDDKAPEPKRKQFKTLNSQDNKNKIKNLLIGLKQIQNKNPTTTHRSGSDLSFDKQNPPQEKLVSTFKTNVLQLQKKKMSGNGNYKTIQTIDPNQISKVPSDYEAHANFQTQKGPLNGISRSNSSKSKIQNHLQQIIKKQQLQKNQMDLSSTLASGAPATQTSGSQPSQASQGHTSKTFQMVQQPSQPGQTPSNSSQMMNSVTNMLKKDKVKVLIGGENTKLSKQDMLIQNQTIQNFNTINGASRGNSVSNPAIILKKQINDARAPTEPNSALGGNRKITMRTNRGNSTSLGQAQGLIKKIKTNMTGVNGGGVSSARNSTGPEQYGDTQLTTLTSNGGKQANLKKRILANQSVSQNLRQFKSAMLK